MKVVPFFVESEGLKYKFIKMLQKNSEGENRDLEQRICTIFCMEKQAKVAA